MFCSRWLLQTTKIADPEQSVEILRFKEDGWVCIIFPQNKTIITRWRGSNFLNGITCLNGNIIHGVKSFLVSLIKCMGVGGLRARPEMESWRHSLFLWDLRQISGHSEPWLPHLQNGPLGLQGYCEASSLISGPQDGFPNAWLLSCLYRHGVTQKEMSWCSHCGWREQPDLQGVPISLQRVDVSLCFLPAFFLVASNRDLAVFFQDQKGWWWWWWGGVFSWKQHGEKQLSSRQDQQENKLL